MTSNGQPLSPGTLSRGKKGECAESFLGHHLSPVLPLSTPFSPPDPRTLPLLHAGSPIAKQLRKVLRRKRELSPSEIPGYMDLIMSGRVGKDGDSDRIHAMLLASGAAATSEFVCGHTPTDAVKPPVSAPMPADAAPGREASLLRRQYVFEMIVGGPRSRDVPRKIKWAACAAVAALCRSPRYGRDLVNRLGLLPWAAQAVREVLTQRPGSSGAFVGRAAVDAVVTLLCGVAAALEHGAERGGAEDVAMDVCTLVDAVCAAAEELKATAPNHARELVRAACKVGTAAASHSSFVEGHAGAASAPSLAHALGRVSSRAVAAGLRAPGLAVQVASAAACGSVAGAALGLLEACSMAGAAETGGFYQVSIAGVPEAATLCALACLGHSGALAVSGTSASKRAVLGGGLDGEEGNKAAAASDIVGVAWGLKGVAEASGGDVAVGADCDVALQMVIRGLAASLEAAEGGETDKSAVEKVRRGALAGAKMLVV